VATAQLILMVTHAPFPHEQKMLGKPNKSDFIIVVMFVLKKLYRFLTDQAGFFGFQKNHPIFMGF
jgi:hypothetical protein